MFYNFDRVADVYDRTRAIPPAATRTIAASISAILRSKSERSRVLEIGVGSGRISGPLSAAGLSVTGIDISRDMLAILHQRAPRVEAVRAEATHLPFRPGSFDAVLFVQILHLVPDIDAAIAAALTCLAPGGLMLELRTFSSPSPLEVVSARISAEQNRLVPPKRPSSRMEMGSAALERAALATGGEHHRGVIATWRETDTLRSLLQALEARTYSATWVLSSAQALAVADSVREEAIAIAGGLDLVHASEMTMTLTVGRIGAIR